MVFIFDGTDARTSSKIIPSHILGKSALFSFASLRSAIQKKGVLGHFASFGPFSLLVDIKRQCPVLQQSFCKKTNFNDDLFCL